MEIIDTITTRRSIRSFLPRKVSEEALQTILECGLRAPSSKNSNPWFFVVTRDGQKDAIASWIEEGANGRNSDARGPANAKTGKISEGTFDSTAESIQAIREASVLVLVFNRAPLSGGKRCVIENPRGGRSLYTYAGELIGIGAAVQNMLLAARGLGLSGVYMADSYPGRAAVESALKTEAEMIGSIAIGYPAYVMPPRDIERSLAATWDTVMEQGIPADNFTVKRESVGG